MKMLRTAKGAVIGCVLVLLVIFHGREPLCWAVPHRTFQVKDPYGALGESVFCKREHCVTKLIFGII